MVKEMSRRWWPGVVAALAVVLGVILAVNAASPRPTAASPTARHSTAAAPTPGQTTTAPSQPPSPPPVPLPVQEAQRTLAALTLEQRVGQVLMVSSPVSGPDAATLAALNEDHVGNVFLKGRSYAGTAAVSGVVASLQAQVSEPATAGVRQFIATDQEGGMVQIMNGPGFSDIPAAVDQGALDPGQLRADAGLWGNELARAGINVNFAPSLDTVPGVDFAPANAPIGHYGREYGYNPADVSAHGVAFAQGMADASVAPAVKHFPGLGRVSANTDTASGVTDEVTVRNGPFIAPFRGAVSSGVRWIMISNASYPSIDPGEIAPFSSIVMRGMVRGDLGFTGIIVSDDICDAVQLSFAAPSDRAADFIAAGGTMALCTNQNVLPQLYQGILARRTADPAFAAVVDAAALKVLEIKAESGLLPAR